MKKRYVILLFLAVIGLGLFFYNYWSYSCGRCNAESLWAISFPAGILIGVNMLAFISLAFVKLRQRRSIDRHRCSCGIRLHSEWQFCPDCGRSRG